MSNLRSPWWESWSYHWMEEKHGIITSTSSTGTQMALIPIFAPMNGRSRLISYHLSNTNSSQVVLTMWDQYLNDPSGFTTAGLGGVRGSNSAPVLQIQVPQNADVVSEAITRPYFQTGVIGCPSAQPLFYSILLAHAALG